MDQLSSPQSHTLYGYYDCNTEHKRRYCRGWDIPDFHRRRKRGELLPQTPWDQIEIYGSASGYYSSTQGTPAGGPHTTVQRYYSDTAGDWTLSLPSTWRVTEEEVSELIPAAYDMYVTEAAAKIYSSGYDALTAIAELTEVRAMFTSAAKKLWHLDFPKNWKTLVSAWLEGRYGWRTFFYDLISLNEAIRNFDETRTRFSERSGNTHTTSVLSSTTIDHSTWGYDLVQNTTSKISMRGSVVADIVVPKFQFNPLQTGWELIPFSFVIDWFVNVGSALAAINFVTFSTKYSASKGYKISICRETATANIWYNGGKAFDFLDFNFWMNARSEGTIEKRVPCGVPILPSSIVKLNAWKVADLLALLSQIKWR
jgi:hypothetical protein